MPSRKIIQPTSPEGKYWFGRHRMLIEVFKQMSESEDEALQTVGFQVLDTEMQLDVDYIQEMQNRIVTTDDNLVIVDKFKGKNGG